MLDDFFIHARKVFVVRSGNLKKLNFVGQGAVVSEEKGGTPPPLSPFFLRGGERLDFMS